MKKRKSIDQETVLYGFLVVATILAIIGGIVGTIVNKPEKQYRYVDEQNAVYMMKYGDVKCEYLPSNDNDTSNDWRCDW